ncbi:MAG: hypothetical protein ACOYUB_04650 [Patescibacteria group bacterium]
MTLNIKEIVRVRKLLGETGKRLTDSEVEKIYFGLNTIINQIIDNNFPQKTICEKQ